MARQISGSYKHYGFRMTIIYEAHVITDGALLIVKIYKISIYGQSISITVTVDTLYPLAVYLRWLSQTLCPSTWIGVCNKLLTSG